jgi:hypothetical protein
MKSLQLVFSMKKLFIAALTAASLLSCPPAAFAQPNPKPTIRLEVVFGTYSTSQGETRGLVPCKTDKTIVAKVNGQFQCIGLTTLYADDLGFDDALAVNNLMQ